MKKVMPSQIVCWNLLICFVFIGGCHTGVEDPHSTAALQARIEVLEKKINEQQKFFDDAKEVIKSHSARITVNQRMMEVLKNPRFQAKVPSTPPGVK